MKRQFFPFLLFAVLTVSAQDISPNLAAAVKEVPVNQEENIALPSASLSYYSTNYFDVFGHDRYTFDKMAFKQRDVYVSSDNRFYRNGTQNLPDALPADPILNYNDYSSNTGSAIMGTAIIGVGTVGLIHNFITGTKDYSPKIDQEAFAKAGRSD